MNCQKYLVNNPTNKYRYFNYQRCKSNFLESQVALLPNREKNVWAIDNTVITAFKDLEVTDDGDFPTIFPTSTPQPTPTPTASVGLTPTPTPSNTPTVTATPTMTQTPSQTPYQNFSLSNLNTVGVDVDAFSSSFTLSFPSYPTPLSGPSGNINGNHSGISIGDTLDLGFTNSGNYKLTILVNSSIILESGSTSPESVTYVFESNYSSADIVEVSVSDYTAETPTPTPSVTPEATPAETPSETPSATPEATPAETPSETPSATPESTPAETPSETPSATPEATPAETPTPTPTETATYFSFELKYDAANPITACASGPVATYYSNSSTLATFAVLATDSNLTVPATDGYYCLNEGCPNSTGKEWISVGGGSGSINGNSNC